MVQKSTKLLGTRCRICGGKITNKPEIPDYEECYCHGRILVDKRIELFDYLPHPMFYNWLIKNEILFGYSFQDILSEDSTAGICVDAYDHLLLWILGGTGPGYRPGTLHEAGLVGVLDKGRGQKTKAREKIKAELTRLAKATFPNFSRMLWPD